MLQNSSVAAQLAAYQEGLSSMELVKPWLQNMELGKLFVSTEVMVMKICCWY
jgi:hypothetical protein